MTHVLALMAEMDRRHVERVEAMDLRLQQGRQDSARAIAKADQANEKRFESVNEFRAQLNDQAASFLTRNEYTINHQALADKIGDMSSRLDKAEGRAGGANRLWGYLLGAAGLLVAIIAVVTTGR